MSIFYHDTSALVKRYHAETGSAVVHGLFVEVNSYHFVSRLTLVELRSAFALKVRTGALSPDEFHAAMRRIQNDWSGHVFHSITVTHGQLRAAEALITKHGLTNNLRTLDAVQLAIALEMQVRGLQLQFVTADKNLCRIATAESLKVINPEQP
jgi:predicted nucleic acid-binding protein